jgi:DNA-binding response OmpR family regulator
LQLRLAHTSEPPPRLVAKMEIKNIDDDNKKRILIIDDEVDITFTFKIGLEDTGLFTVDTSNDPQDVLFNFKPKMYDLLLIDIRMPKGGYELYKEVRKIDAKIKVIFLTASESFEDFQKVFPTFDKKYYIMKPIEIAELIKRINGIVAPNLS